MDIDLFGLTGAVASGKSTVAKMMRQIGFPIIDIDDMLYDMLNSGTVAHRELLNLLGPKVLKVDGAIDTTILSIMMCKEDWIASTVEDIIEEEIDDILYRITNALQASRVNVAGIESARILESRVKSHLKKIIVVIADKDLRTQRLLNRSNISNDVANQIICSSNDNTFEKEADFVIYNDVSLIDLEKTVNDTSKKLLLSLASNTSDI